MSDQTTIAVVLASESTVGNPIIETVTVLGTVPIGPRGADGSASGVTDGDKGDITVSSDGTVWSIDAGAVGTDELAAGAVTAAKVAADVATQAELDAEASARAAADTALDGRLDTIEAISIATDAELASAIFTSEAGQVRDGDTAGGVLSGTYPNPGFAADMATQAELTAAVEDLIAGDGSITSIVALTQAEYDLLTPDATTYYIITDATGSGGVQSVDGETGDVDLSDTYAQIPLVDTAANLAASNPVLAAGRFGYTTDTAVTKVGDGTTAWNSLLVLRIAEEPVRASTTTQQTLIASVTDVTGLSITFDVGAVPWIVHAHHPYVVSVGGSGFSGLRITDAAGTNKAIVELPHYAAAISNSGDVYERITTPGTYTRKVRLLKVGGALTSVTSLLNVATLEAYIEAGPEK